MLEGRRGVTVCVCGLIVLSCKACNASTLSGCSVAQFGCDVMGGCDVSPSGSGVGHCDCDVMLFCGCGNI